MRIAVDAFPLAHKTSTGIPVYLKNALLNLLQIDKGNEYFLYCKNFFEIEQKENLHLRCASASYRNFRSYENTIWLFTKAISMMKKDRIEVFWGTRQMLPPYLPKGMKKVLTVYDLVWHYFPETMAIYNRLVMNFFVKKSIISSDHIITISRATAKALVDIMKVPEEKISVICPAADGYISLDKNYSADYISNKYGTYKNYILTVSTVEPRKNLAMLLKVFSEFKHENMQLLIAGASGWKTSSIYKEYEKLGFSEREVKFLGYIPDEDMNRLYSGAGLFVFPSVYEGFGMPLLEAMASGTPVISSNSSSLPEVVGDAGFLINPYNIDEWRGSITKVISDTAIKKEMIIKGLERSKLFSWKKSARQTLEVFEKFV